MCSADVDSWWHCACTSQLLWCQVTHHRHRSPYCCSVAAIEEHWSLPGWSWSLVSVHGRCSPELRCFTFLPLISSTSPPRPLGCNENPLISTRGNEMSIFWGFHTKISVDLKNICWSSYNLYEEQRRRLLLIRFRESEVWWIHSESRNLNADNSTWIDNKNVILSRQKVSGLSKIIWLKLKAEPSTYLNWFSKPHKEGKGLKCMFPLIIFWPSFSHDY